MIAGTIRAADTSSILPGMVVAAYDASGLVAASATSDATGRYTFTLSPGQYHLLAYDNSGVYATAFDNGADSYEASPVRTIGTDPLTVDFQLSFGGMIIGTTRFNGLPASGLTIAVYNLSGTRRGTTQTNAQGAYSLLVPSGQYKLVAFDTVGFVGPIFYAKKLSFADATPVTVTAKQSVPAIDFAFDPAAVVTGTVIDAASGSALSPITVYAYTAAGNIVRSATTDASGHFKIILTAGSYRLVSGDPADVYASAFLGNASTFAQSTALTLGAGQTADVTLSMNRGGQLKGHILDNVTGAAAAGIQVAAYNPDGTPRVQATADSNGAFSVVVPQGTYRVGAYDVTLVYATQFFQGRSDFWAAQTVSSSPGQITPAVDFSLVHAGRLTGTVRDATTNDPLGGITVAAYDDALTQVAEAVSDANGRFTLAIAPGTYRIVAWDAAHAYANSFDGGTSNLELTSPRTLATDTTQTTTFLMRRGIALVGKVVNASQAAVGGITVDALDVDGHHIAGATTADDGSFLFAVLPGTYKLYVHDAWQRYLPTFFGRTLSLASAAVVLVPSSGSPAPVTITVFGSSRRRSVVH